VSQLQCFGDGRAWKTNTQRPPVKNESTAVDVEVEPAAVAASASLIFGDGFVEISPQLCGEDYPLTSNLSTSTPPGTLGFLEVCLRWFAACACSQRNRMLVAFTKLAARAPTPASRSAALPRTHMWTVQQRRLSSTGVDEALRSALAQVAAQVQQADPAARPLITDDFPGVRTPGPKMLLRFTCTHEPCDEKYTITRIISKRSYDSGIVLVRCPCRLEKQHLIADNLGWFGDKSNIETIMAEKGEEVARALNDGLMYIDPPVVDASASSSTQDPAR